jgi:hypothetical protein
MTRAAQTHIDMTFCASLTEHLPRLLPGPVRHRLRRRAVDLLRIAADARQREFAPGELFCFADEAMVLRAWLE